MFVRMKIIFLFYVVSTVVEAEPKCKLLYQSVISSESVYSCHSVSSLSELNLFSTDTEILFIRHSVIETIPTNALHSKLPNLRILELERLNVEEIASGAFDGLPSLEDLDLDHNHITILHPRSFPPNLNTVTLNNNSISTIEPGAFEGLRAVKLSNNKIESIDEDTFKGGSGLEEVDLSHNKIRNIHQNAFKEAEHLRKLDLSYNEISDLSPDFISKSNNLQTLILDNNSLTVVRSGWFSNLVEFRSFYAARNKIKVVEPLSFKNSSKLFRIDLSQNEISHIPNICGFERINLIYNYVTDEDADSMIRCPYLYVLSLEHNKIKHFKLESFENSNLEEFSFANNGIEEFDLSIFSKLQNASEAKLDHNKIIKLDNSLLDEVKIKQLHLEYNKIEEIKENIFKNFKDLRNVHLEHNEISKVNPGAFNSLKHNPLKYFDDYEAYLQFNKIKSFRNWFVEGSKVGSINISHNEVEKLEIISLKGAYLLWQLDLSHNKISDIEQNAIKGFENLENIYLHHNNLTVLNENTAVDCPKLRILDFSFNYIESIKPEAFKNVTVKNIYLQNNRLTAFSESIFAGISHLHFLNVSHNQIESISPNVFYKGELTEDFILDASYNKLKNVSGEVFRQLFPAYSSTSFNFNYKGNQIEEKYFDSFLKDFVEYLKVYDYKIILTTSLDNVACGSLNGTFANEECVIKLCKERYCYI